MPAGKTALTVKISLIGIEGELVAAAFGSFDDDLEDTVLFVQRFQLRGIGQALRRFLCQCGAPC